MPRAYSISVDAIAAERRRVNDDLEKFDVSRVIRLDELALRPMGPSDVHLKILAVSAEHNVDHAALARRAVERLGPHPAVRAGLDLAEPADRARWLVLARLLSERVRDEVALAAFARLAADPGAEPAGLAGADPAHVAAALAEAGMAKPEVIAAVLCRSARALCERHRGDLESLAAGSDDFEALGRALTALAPGLGAASVLRFLRPLRDAWTAARETPLAAPARAAAIHLGLLGESEDLDGEPAALRALCANELGDLAANDVESALERLGAEACRAGRIERCPLGADCPQSAQGEC